MAKGITNGCMPMGAVAAREGIYESIVEAAKKGVVELFHGYTYSGAPAAVRGGFGDARDLQKRGPVREG